MTIRNQWHDLILMRKLKAHVYSMQAIRNSKDHYKKSIERQMMTHASVFAWISLGIEREIKPTVRCEVEVKKQRNLLASSARGSECGLDANTFTLVRVRDRSQIVEKRVKLCVLHSSEVAVDKLITQIERDKIIAEIEREEAKKRLEQEITDKLLEAPVADRTRLVDALVSGYAGILAVSGQIVDRRQFPNATEIEECEALGIPKPRKAVEI